MNNKKSTNLTNPILSSSILNSSSLLKNREPNRVYSTSETMTNPLSFMLQTPVQHKDSLNPNINNSNITNNNFNNNTTINHIKSINNGNNTVNMVRQNSVGYINGHCALPLSARSYSVNTMTHPLLDRTMSTSTGSSGSSRNGSNSSRNSPPSYSGISAHDIEDIKLKKKILQEKELYEKYNLNNNNNDDSSSSSRNINHNAPPSYSGISAHDIEDIKLKKKILQEKELYEKYNLNNNNNNNNDDDSSSNSRNIDHITPPSYSDMSANDIEDIKLKKKILQEKEMYEKYNLNNNNNNNNDDDDIDHNNPNNGNLPPYSE